MGFFIPGYSSQLADLTNSNTVAAVANTYTLDIGNSATKMFDIETEDAVAKTVALSNIPTDCEFFITLTYTNAAAITWFSGITWLTGSAPVLTAGKTYEFRFITTDGGTTWRGANLGGWS